VLTDIRETIARRLKEVLLDGKPDAPVDRISPAARLNADLGLDSLGLAQLVALLEQDLRADPFAELVPITSVRTVADLYAAYESALAARQAGEPAELDEARRRASARRARRG